MKTSLKSIASLFENTQGLIILTTHVHPDGDALGSLLALYHGLQQKKCDVMMILDDHIPSFYKFLPGCEQIQTFSRMDPSCFTSAQLLVLLDASDRSRMGNLQQLSDIPLVNIDHHLSNNYFADYSYLDVNAAATGEIVIELLKKMHIPLSPAIATCLYTAIASDCGFFRYGNTTPKTLRYASSLVAAGASPAVISDALDKRPYLHMQVLCKALQTLEMYDDGKIAVMILAPDMYNRSDDATEGLINFPRSIEGVEVAVLFKIVHESEVRISFRSQRVDVSRLAAVWGGGGHFRAAGCTAQGSFSSVKKQVITAAIQAIQEVDNDRNH